MFCPTVCSQRSPVPPASSSQAIPDSISSPTSNGQLHATPNLCPQSKSTKCTVGQNNQESRREYWATRSSTSSFSRTAHSFVCTAQSFACSALLTWHCSLPLHAHFACALTCLLSCSRAHFLAHALTPLLTRSLPCS